MFVEQWNSLEQVSWGCSSAKTFVFSNTLCRLSKELSRDAKLCLTYLFQLLLFCLLLGTTSVTIFTLHIWPPFSRVLTNGLQEWRIRAGYIIDVKVTGLESFNSFTGSNFNQQVWAASDNSVIEDPGFSIQCHILKVGFSVHLTAQFLYTTLIDQ